MSRRRKRSRENRGWSEVKLCLNSKGLSSKSSRQLGLLNSRTRVFNSESPILARADITTSRNIHPEIGGTSHGSNQGVKKVTSPMIISNRRSRFLHQPGLSFSCH